VVNDEKGNVIAMVGVARDITHRKQDEASLRESEERYRQLIETMQDGIYRSSHEGKFLEVNPAMVKILGYNSKEELLAIDIKKQLYFDPGDRESAALEQKLEEIAVFRLRRKDGSEVWVEDHGRHIVDENGNVLYHEGVLRDVTERKLAEDALGKSTREREKLIQELRFALDNVKTLQGLIPICANCKKIRDDKGYWNQVEGYIMEHSDATFTHGVCPDCAKKIFEEP
jgi:PAS domain S-box-containing protein